MDVFASRPLPQHFPDRMVHEVKGLLGDGVPVIVRPATNDRVQKMDQVLLGGRSVGIHHVRYFGPEGCTICLGGLLQQCSSFPVFSEVPSEEIKTLSDVCRISRS